MMTIYNNNTPVAVNPACQKACQIHFSRIFSKYSRKNFAASEKNANFADAKSFIGEANSYGLHWELFFCQDIRLSNINKYCAYRVEIRKRLQNNPMDDLAARSRRILGFMLNHPMKIFQYNGSPVSFQKGDSVMVNATEMAKPFGKVAKDWLRTKQSQDFITSLSAVRQICLTGLVVIQQGGSNEQGTWMHEDVALEFARWLSPVFAIWCNDRIKELLTMGVATVSNDDEAIAYAMDVLRKRLEQAKAEKAMLEQQNNYLTNEIRQAAPKVQYVDSVLQSVNTYTVQQIAKELDTTSNRLYAFLKANRVMFRQSGQWLLTAKYNGHGYTKTRTHQFMRNDGSVGTSSYTVFTERGREFLHKMLDSVSARKGGAL